MKKSKFTQYERYEDPYDDEIYINDIKTAFDLTIYFTYFNNIEYYGTMEFKFEMFKNTNILILDHVDIDSVDTAFDDYCNIVIHKNNKFVYSSKITKKKYPILDEIIHQLEKENKFALEIKNLQKYYYARIEDFKQQIAHADSLKFYYLNQGR